MMTQNKNLKALKRQVGKHFQGLSSAGCWNLSKMLVFSLITFSGAYFFFSFSSCQEPEIHIDRATRKVIDTLVIHKIDSLNPILDSLCIERKEALIKVALDSILEKRKKQEERLRKITK